MLMILVLEELIEYQEIFVEAYDLVPGITQEYSSLNRNKQT